MKLLLNKTISLEAEQINEGFYLNEGDQDPYVLNITLEDNQKDLEEIAQIFSSDNLSTIEIFDSEDNLLKTYTNYKILFAINRNYNNNEEDFNNGKIRIDLKRIVNTN